jgi:nucleoside-diphosphate-sugar epimerase
MKVLVTGAHGTVGTAITEHLDPTVNERVADRPNPPELCADEGAYEFVLLDRRESPTDHPHEGLDTVVADVADREELVDAFAAVDAEGDVDAVVHLAGEPSTDSSWEVVLPNNVVGTHNALEAAHEIGADQFVFASSNHVVGMYEVENRPEIYEETDLLVDHTSQIRPDSEYGASKAAGESFLSKFAENEGLAGYALRIGSVRDPAYDHPYGDAERGVADGRWERGSDEYETQAARLSCTWQSRRDVANMVDCCLRDTAVTFEVFYGVSDNERRWWDLGHAREVIDYDPRDSAEEWREPPEWSGGV